MDNVAAVLIIIVLAYLLWKCRCKKEGMLPGTRGGAVLNIVGSDNFYNQYKIRCPGDREFGNVIIPVNPMDAYSNVGVDSKFGYMFQYKDDEITKGVYKSPRDAAEKYCANPLRVKIH